MFEKGLQNSPRSTIESVNATLLSTLNTKMRIEISYLQCKKTFNVKKQDENIYSAIYEAFDAIERMIDKYNQKNNKDFRHRLREHKLADVFC